MEAECKYVQEEISHKVALVALCLQILLCNSGTWLTWSSVSVIVSISLYLLKIDKKGDNKCILIKYVFLILVSKQS